MSALNFLVTTNFTLFRCFVGAIVEILFSCVSDKRIAIATVSIFPVNCKKIAEDLRDFQ